MKKIKKQNNKTIKKSSEEIDHIVFSFRYLTKNKNYNLNYFKKDTRGSHKAHSQLFKKMIELSAITILDAKDRGKIQGCEYIKLNTCSAGFKESCKTIDILSGESALSVFRFSENDYRLICKSDLKHPNLLHIIGFDFNYSAYNHGS